MTNRDRFRNGMRIGLRLAIYFAALSILSVGYWIRNTFGEPTLPQLLYHLHFAESLVSTTDRVFLLDFLGECVLKPALMSVALLALDRYFAAQFRARSGGVPKPHLRTLESLGAAFPTLLLGIGCLLLAAQFSVLEYARARLSQQDPFAEHYVDPRMTRIQPVAPRNLILIYVESLELAYGDAGLFGEDLLASLKAIPGANFEAFRPSPGVGWTMAGIVATQCGVPLRFVTRMARVQESGNDSARLVESFMPGAKCLGDILKQHGYTNVFLGGANLAFAGKGKFLLSHGYDQAYGLREWREQGTELGTLNGWGLYDDQLFEMAREKVQKLHHSGRPFNLTILTLDTHHPHGHVSKYCNERGAREFVDIVSCTADQVADFYEFLSSSGYLRDTNVVVIGDHLAMPNPAYDVLQRVSDRRIFNKFISPTVPSKRREELLPFDLFATILNFVGFAVEGDCLALGCSGFGSGPASGGKLGALPPAALDYSPAYERLWLGEPSQ